MFTAPLFTRAKIWKQTKHCFKEAIPFYIPINNMCTLTLISALFTIAKIWKQPMYPSVDEWIKMQWYTYTMEYYLAIKRKKILPFANSMEGPREHGAK